MPCLLFPLQATHRLVVENGWPILVWGSFILCQIEGGSASFIVDYNFSYAGASTRPDIRVLGIAPNIDKWFKKGYIGYYATWTYNFENKIWDIPLDIEAGYPIAKQFTFSAEYILPLLANATYNNSWST